MILHYSRNPNPRLAVAVARHLGSAVIFVPASPFAPGQAETYRRLNPSLSIPILEEEKGTLWEADAIACRLSRLSKTDFWRIDDEGEPDMIRWLSWGKANFVMACDQVHFEYGTKQRYGMGAVDMTKVEEGLALFHRSAPILDAHLTSRSFLLDSGLSYADFRMASFLPFNDVAGLPLSAYPALQDWYHRLDSLPSWHDPFEGLDAPALPKAMLAAERLQSQS
ncbi:glutathione S-transferase [Rhizobium sp. Root274]|uniref:glutathione S-transferase family protein n=1 Tax=unclassified Rhizobium TaxID=2613769 RepID=UPI000713873F|nr:MULTISPECIES: glutathione S-transferase family protein [unclassified Rhizobium]KQW29050.1 glutathione S-transferase [Rhizobium sp. Root1240]KRD29246.1 glutathione S-transferase [Rhizobium sp. Root274]